MKRTTRTTYTTVYDKISREKVHDLTKMHEKYEFWPKWWIFRRKSIFRQNLIFWPKNVLFEALVTRYKITRCRTFSNRFWLSMAQKLAPNAYCLMPYVLALARNNCDTNFWFLKIHMLAGTPGGEASRRLTFIWGSS